MKPALGLCKLLLLSLITRGIWHVPTGTSHQALALMPGRHHLCTVCQKSFNGIRAYNTHRSISSCGTNAANRAAQPALQQRASSPHRYQQHQPEAAPQQDQHQASPQHQQHEHQHQQHQQQQAGSDAVRSSGQSSQQRRPATPNPPRFRHQAMPDRLESIWPRLSAANQRRPVQHKLSSHNKGPDVDALLSSPEVRDMVDILLSVSE